MCERKKEKDGVAAVGHVRAHAHGGGDEVLVGQHAALRRAGRAGRVDQCSEIVLADLERSRLERVGIRLGVRLAFRLELRQLCEGEHLVSRTSSKPNRR